MIFPTPSSSFSIIAKIYSFRYVISQWTNSVVKEINFSVRFGSVWACPDENRLREWRKGCFLDMNRSLFRANVLNGEGGVFSFHFSCFYGFYSLGPTTINRLRRSWQKKKKKITISSSKSRNCKFSTLRKSILTINFFPCTHSTKYCIWKKKHCHLFNSKVPTRRIIEKVGGGEACYCFALHLF